VKLDKAQETATAVWLEEVLPKWDQVRSSRKKSLWRGGIPPAARGAVWMKAIGNELMITPFLYSQWVEQARSLRKIPVPGGGENTYRMIELDLPRTYPSLSLFHKDGPYHSQLQEVLETYAFYRPDVGYVQGMSFVAGMFLFYLEPYEAFVCFSNLLNAHFFLSLYNMDIPQILRHMKLFNSLFLNNLPTLYFKFKNLGISAEQYLLDWYMAIFTKALPVQLVHRIWDCVLLEGEVFMHRAAVGILKACRNSLENGSFEFCVTFLRAIPQQSEDAMWDSILSIKIPDSLKSIVTKLDDEVPQMQLSTKQPE